MSTLLGLLAIVVLTIGTAWFVAAEFAVVVARRRHLEEAAQAGERSAVRALKLVDQLSFTLSGAQLGITVTALAVGFIAEPVFDALLTPLLVRANLRETVASTIALVIGLVLSTGLQMILGELGPKNLAIAKAEEVARSLSRGQLIYLTIAGPAIRLFDGAANLLLRLVGIEPMHEGTQAVTVEELEHIITASSESGTLAAPVSALLQRSIEFRGLRADDAMRPRADVVSIPTDASCQALLELASRTGYSRFPVTGTGGLDDIQGVVHLKELMGVPLDQRDITPVRALSEPELAVPESASLRDVLLILRDAHAQLAVVIDEFGGTAGIVTLEDIIEELVGDIRDEHDRSERSAVRRADGSWQVPGLWRMDEVRRDTGIQLPEGEHDTVSGLVMAALGRVPKVGDRVAMGPVTIDVLAVQRHAVQTVRMTVALEGNGEGTGAAPSDIPAGEDPTGGPT